MAWDMLENDVSPEVNSECLESLPHGKSCKELMAAGSVGWLFLQALWKMLEKDLLKDAQIRKLNDEISLLQKQQIIMRETLESSRERSKIRIQALIRNDTWDPNVWSGDVSDSESEQTFVWDEPLEVRIAELDCFEGEELECVQKKCAYPARRLITNKSKGKAGGGNIQNTRIVRHYTQTELLHIGKLFRKRAGKQTLKWLLRVWDTGSDGIFLTPEELLKMGSITTNVMLGHILRGALGQQGSHSLFNWLQTALTNLYASPMDMEEMSGHWNSLPKATDQLREMDLQCAMYSENYAGPDMELFTADMRVRLLRNAPGHMK
ncbi:Friend virus susceptibility protein 1-like [Ambystoma mexicanum]|uniref:Friend virus susceptibility protein 1-like n=1 Tax=Ambystoma mexicanum TaxID=8296 RepID=UPI0037E84A79